MLVSSPSFLRLLISRWSIRRLWWWWWWWWLWVLVYSLMWMFNSSFFSFFLSFFFSLFLSVWLRSFSLSSYSWISHHPSWFLDFSLISHSHCSSSSCSSFCPKLTDQSIQCIYSIIQCISNIIQCIYSIIQCILVSLNDLSCISNNINDSFDWISLWNVMSEPSHILLFWLLFWLIFILIWFDG